MPTIDEIRKNIEQEEDTIHLRTNGKQEIDKAFVTIFNSMIKKGAASLDSFFNLTNGEGNEIKVCMHVKIVKVEEVK